MLPKYKHVYNIPKGQLGEFSKIEEEFLELRDAHLQGIAGFEIVEISDLLGAISHYLWSKYSILFIFVYLLSGFRGLYKTIKRRLK